MRFAVVVPLAVFAAGCCDDHVSDASTSLFPNLSIGYYSAWVGDTTPLYSAALSISSSSPIWCDNVVYSSEDHPGRFQYATTDPAAGIVDERGRFVALAVGRTGIVTTTAGVRDTTFVTVGPAFASLRISVTPQSVRVGDTVTVQLDALDGTGAGVTGAEVFLVWIDNPRDSLAMWIRTLRAERPFPSTTFQAPLTDRLVLQRPGVLRLVASAPHDTGLTPVYPADTLSLTIAPSPAHDRSVSSAH